MEDDIHHLWQTVQLMGDQIQILTTRSILRCEWNFTQFCVTPISYNISHEWDHIKRLLWGHKNTSLKIQKLEARITAIFTGELPKLNGEEVWQGLSQTLNNLNPLGQIKAILASIISNSAVILIIILFVLAVLRRKANQQS